jgi:hypothetical protein
LFALSLFVLIPSTEEELFFGLMSSLRSGHSSFKQI